MGDGGDVSDSDLECSGKVVTSMCLGDEIQLSCLEPLSPLVDIGEEEDGEGVSLEWDDSVGEMEEKTMEEIRTLGDTSYIS